MRTAWPMPVLMLLALLATTCGGARNTAHGPDSATDHRYGGPREADSLFLSLERTPCFGRCPAYLIQVYRSGFATFDGRSNTALKGPHTGRLSHSEMRTLLGRADTIGFFGLKDTYDGPVTDLPRTIMRIVANGKDKQVTARYQVPEAFRRFALEADSLLFPRPWTPAPVLD